MNKQGDRKVTIELQGVRPNELHHFDWE